MQLLIDNGTHLSFEYNPGGHTYYNTVIDPTAIYIMLYWIHLFRVNDTAIENVSINSRQFGHYILLLTLIVF